MRYRGLSRTPGGALSFNATPMVDVIFLLTIFFMLVSTFSAAENIPLDLPDPEASQAKDLRETERVVINCRYNPEAARSRGRVLYSIGPNQPVPLPVLADRLARRKVDMPNLTVIVRADRRLPYVDVHAVMEVVAGQGIELLNVVAEMDPGATELTP
jgi:biopolymer transport protein ExbD